MNIDQTHYVIVCRYKSMIFVPERGYAIMTDRNDTIRDIRKGEVEGVQKVLAFNPVEGWAHDVTEDLAIDIANSLDASEPVRRELYNFIEQHAGPGFVRGLRVADSALAYV
jgi:hypothetical protein